MKRVFAFLTALVMMVTVAVSTVSVYAADYGCDIDTYSTNVYIENLNTGTVVYEESAGERVPPASLTKMMTYIIVSENVPNPESTYITVTSESLEALDPESSVMGLTGYIGSQFSVLDLLYGLMLPSGNDAALVLADYIGDGSVETFVNMMNTKASQLKCADTNFVNPHGLYEVNHYSTAYDLAVIAKYAMQKPYFKEICASSRYSVPGMSEQLKTTNYLIDPTRPEYYYEYANGVKTGYTDEAGKCLVSTATKDGYDYLCVALGSPYSYAEDVNYAMIDSKALYEWMFENIHFENILSKTEIVGSVDVLYGVGEKNVSVCPQEDIVTLLQKGFDKSIITTEVKLDDSVGAPVEKNQVLGTVSVYYDGELVDTTNLVAVEDIKRNPVKYFFYGITNYIRNHIFVVTIIAVLVLCVVFLMLKSRSSRKKRQSRRRYR